MEDSQLCLVQWGQRWWESSGRR